MLDGSNDMLSILFVGDLELSKCLPERFQDFLVTADALCRVFQPSKHNVLMKQVAAQPSLTMLMTLMYLQPNLDQLWVNLKLKWHDF